MDETLQYNHSNEIPSPILFLLHIIFSVIYRMKFSMFLEGIMLVFDTKCRCHEPNRVFTVLLQRWIMFIEGFIRQFNNFVVKNLRVLT